MSCLTSENGGLSNHFYSPLAEGRCPRPACVCSGRVLDKPIPGKIRSSRKTNSVVRKVLSPLFKPRIGHPTPIISSDHAVRNPIKLTHLVELG